MKYYKRISVLICLLCWVFVGSAFGNNASIDRDTLQLKPTLEQSMLCKRIAEIILNYNYKKVQLDDSLSKEIFDRYLNSLDENRIYFMATDIDRFKSYSVGLSNDIREGNLEHVFEMFNLFRLRYRANLKLAVKFIDQTYPFDSEMRYTFDRKGLPWMAHQGEMVNFWKLKVTYDLLNLSLAGGKLDKNKQILRERYQRLDQQFAKLTNRDVFQYFMDAFTGAIDPHTNYFNASNAAEFNIQMSRQLEGIGVTMVSENDYITIKGIVPGGPAYKSKQIALEDRIVAVAQGEDGKFQDVVGWRIDDVVALTRGKQGSVVRLEVLRADQLSTVKPKVVTMIREKIVLADQSAKAEVREYQNNGNKRKIGIISIPAFYVDFKAYQEGIPNYKSTTRDVMLLLDSLQRQDIDGLLVDLRSNGGGSLWEAVSLVGLFIKNGPVVQVRTVEQGIEVESDQDSSIAYSGPLAVLVDRYSASASEIFAGAIQDYGRGIIIGSRTYGKGTVQTQIDLNQFFAQSEANSSAPNDVINSDSLDASSSYGQLNLTIGKFYRINGNSTQHRGVSPDIDFPTLIRTDRYGEDTERAALPFDTVPQTDFKKQLMTTKLIPLLRRKHQERMLKDPKLQYLKNNMDLVNNRLESKSIILNENKIRLERDLDEKASLRGIDKIQKASGSVAQDKKQEMENLLMEEAVQILKDLVQNDRKQDIVVNL